MAKKIWSGHATDESQSDIVRFDEDECTILAEGSDLIFKCNDKVISVSAGGSSEAGAERGDKNAMQTLLLAAEAAINSSTIPEFAELLAQAESPDTDEESPFHRLRITGREAGKPFTLSVEAPYPTIDVDVLQEGGPGQNEIQSFWISPAPTGGVYYVLWDLGSGVETSGPIAFDADADGVKAAILSGMASLTDADLTVTGTGIQSDPFVLALEGAFEQTAVDELSIDASNLLGNGQVIVTTIVPGDSGRNEVQRIQLSSGTNGGTFTLTFDGQTTGTIAWNASASTLQSALEGLSNIAPGDVSVTKSGTIWTVTFGGVYAATNVPEMTGDGTSLTSSGGSLTISTTQQGLDGGFNTRITGLRTGHGLGPSIKLKIGSQYTPARAMSAWTQAQLISDIEAITGAGTISLVGGFKGHSTGDNLHFAWKWIGAKAFSTTTIYLYDSAGNFLVADDTITYGTIAGLEKAEVQIINLTNATGGTYTLTFDGQTTAPIAWNASALTVEQALEALSNLAPADVEVFNGDANGSTAQNRHILAVKFQGAYEDTDVPQITIDTTSLTGGGSVSTLLAGNSPNQRNEIQRIIVNASGGTYTLTFDGQTTGSIAVGASAGDVQTALEGLSNIDPGDVDVSGSGTSSDPYYVEFTGALAATNVPQMTGSVGGLTGGSVTVTTLTQGEAPVNEQQSIYVVGDDGTFTLSYDDETTVALDHDAAAAIVEAALEALTGVDDVVVSGSGTIEDPWLVEFKGSLAGTNVDPIEGDGTNLTGGFSAEITTEQDGTPPLPTIWRVILYCASGGDFAFTFRGRRTDDIAFGANAAAVLAALEALNPGDFTGLFAVEGDGTEEDPYLITAGGRLAGTPQSLLAHNEGLTGAAQGIIHFTEQEATGRHWWTNPVNWKDFDTGLSGLPGPGDEVWLQTGDESNSILYGLLQSALKLKSFIKSSLFTGHIGLPLRTETGYVEYRPTHLEIGFQNYEGDATILIGNDRGQGSGRINLDTGDDEVHIRVERTDGPAEPGFQSLNWRGSNEFSTLELIEGFVGVAAFAFETARLAQVRQRGGILHLSAGTVIDAGGPQAVAIDKTGGDLYDDGSQVTGRVIIRG